jgi:hypothetical protein
MSWFNFYNKHFHYRFLLQLFYLVSPLPPQTSHLLDKYMKALCTLTWITAPQSLFSPTADFTYTFIFTEIKIMRFFHKLSHKHPVLDPRSYNFKRNV